MKKLHSRIIACLFLVSLFCVSCGNIEMEEALELDYYFKLQGTYYDDYLTGACLSEDNTVMVAGYSNWDYERDIAFCTRSDIYGMIDWKVEWSRSNSMRALDIVEVSTGYAALCTEQVDLDSVAVWVYYISTEGELEDSTMLVQNVSTVANGVLMNNNEALTLVTFPAIENRITEEVTNYIDVFQVSNREIEAEPYRTYIPFVSEDNTIKKTTWDGDVFYVVVGGSEDIFNVVYTAAISKTQVEWDNYYNTTSEVNTGIDVLYTDDMVQIVGNVQESSSDDLTVQLLNFDKTDGDFIDQSTLPLSLEGLNLWCSAFVINSQGNYVFAGQAAYSDISSDIFIYETDSQGNYVQHTLYGAGSNESGLNQAGYIYELPDAMGYQLLGNLYSINNYDICNFKVNQFLNWIY